MVVKLGWATQVSVKLLVASLIPGVLSAAISPEGAATVTQYVDRHGGGNFIGVGYVEFSGLTANTTYTYTIFSTSEASISGQFTTAPSDYRCAFTISTCDSDEMWDTGRPFAVIKNLARNYAKGGIPFAMLHIDDPQYVDTSKTNIAGWPTQTYNTQSECQSRFFARGWAKWLGLFNPYTKWAKDEDRQWVYRNVPSHATVGDHGFASNFRRGPTLVGGTDYWVNAIASDGKSWTEAQIEAAALPEVQAWIAAIGPPVSRSGVLYSSAEYGPVKIFFSDMQLHSTAWAGTADPGPCLGSQQITDMMSALDTSSHPLKLLTLESGLSQYGQAWHDRYPTEASAWHADMLTRANLNGTNGHLFLAYGDNHNRHTISYSNFWAFSAGVLQDARAVGAYQTVRNKAASLAFGGKLRWAEGCIAATGDNPLSGFWLFDCFDAHIEGKYINGINGKTIYGPVRLDYAQSGNQWRNSEVTYA